jgi:hypothetical protein
MTPKEIIGLDDIYPDDIRIVLDWGGFGTEASMFVPCLNVERCVKQFKAIAERKNVKVRHKILVEGNILGVRFWRTT